MKRLPLLVRAAALLLALCPLLSHAEDAPPPKGVRVFTCAHSFHAFVYRQLEDVAKSAGIKDHQMAGFSSIGGSKVIQHWDAPDEKFGTKPALIAGKVDVLTLSPIWMPDEGIDKFAKLAFEHNPNVRVTVQEFWLPNDVYEPKYPLDVRKGTNHDATNLDELQKAQDKYDQDVDAYCRGINEALGKQVIFTVPVGQAAVALRRKVVAGEIPSLTKQWDLFRDSWGHPQLALQMLDSYCHYAVIYRRSPVGIPLPALSAKAKGATATLDESLNHLLQVLAWEAVTHHPMSGVTAAAK